MFADLLLTLVIGGGIAFLIFILCFNTKKIPINEGGKKKQNKKKKKKKKGKNKNGNSNNYKKFKLTNITPKTIVDLKPKINLDDHENLISVFRGHIANITGIAWHQSGKYLLSSSEDQHIYIWKNPTTPTVTASFIGSTQTVDNGYFTTLHSVISPNYVHEETKFDEENKESEDPFKGYTKIQNSIFASTNGSFGLNSFELKLSINKKIRFQMTSHTQTKFFKNNIRCLRVPESMAFVVASSGQNTKLYFYDIRQKIAAQERLIKRKKLKIPKKPNNTKEMLAVKEMAKEDKEMLAIEGGQFENYEMNISMDGKWLSIGSFKKDIRLWRVNYVKPGKRDVVKEYRFGGVDLLCSLIHAHEKPVSTVTFSCDSQFMVSASKDGCVKVWDIINVDYARGYKPEMVFESDLGIGVIYDLVMSYQYDIAAVLNEERRSIFVYKIKYEKQKMKLHCRFDNVVGEDKDKKDGDRRKINCVRFSPDSQYIAVGSGDQDVRVYKIPKKASK